MTIQVTGILRSPTGTPLPNKEIRIISTVGSLLVLAGSFKVVTSSATGVYDFNLEDGQYIIDVLYEDEAVIAGSSIVNMGTPTPVTLSELFLYTTPLNPQQVIDLQTEFQLLIDNLQNAFDTEKQEIRQQLIDGDASTLQTAQTFTNTRLGAEMAVITAVVTAGDASVLSQATAYTDTAGNLIAADVTQLQVDTLSVTSQFQATRDAQGITNGLIRTEIADGIITAIASTRTYSDLATGNLQVLLTSLINIGDATVLQTAGINAQSLNDATEAFLLDQIIVAGQGSVSGYEAYTIASLGYLDPGTLLWVDGPLSSSFRKHTVSTSDGGYANIEDAMQTMAKPDGTLVAKGSLISDVNGRIAGYRHSNDGVTTDFEIIADQFKVGHMESSVFVPDLQFNTVTKLLELKGDAIIDGTLAVTALTAGTITSEYIASDAIRSLNIKADEISGIHIKASSTIVVGAPFEYLSSKSITKASGNAPNGTVYGFHPHFDGDTGSMADKEVFGIQLKAIYTENDDNSGWGTWVIFETAIPNLTGNLFITVDGTEYDMGMVGPVTFTHFYAVGLQIFNLLANGAYGINFRLEATDNDAEKAGMNGYDDGTGTGADTLRFWSGASSDNAHLANFRVNRDGDIYSGGNLDIEGIATIGAGATSVDHVKIFGNGAAGGSTPWLQVRKDNINRILWGFDGRLIIYKADGVTKAIDFNTNTDVYSFSGKVTAEGGVFGGTVILASGTSNVHTYETDSGDQIQGAYQGNGAYPDSQQSRLIAPAPNTEYMEFMLDTGYTALNFYNNTRQFVATATRAGTWVYKTSKASFAASGVSVKVIPMQFVSGDTTYNDARIYLSIRVYYNWMRRDTSAGVSQIRWKLSELLLNE